MSGVFICQKCKNKVIPKKGWLSCCGISEKVSYSKQANEDYKISLKVRRKFINRFLDDVYYEDIFTTNCEFSENE